MAAILDNSELFGRVMICLPNAFSGVNPNVDPAKDDDDEGEEDDDEEGLTVVMTISSDRARLFLIYFTCLPFCFNFCNQLGLEALHCNPTLINIVKWSFCCIIFFLCFLV